MLTKPQKWAYGIHAEVVQPAVAKKLLDRSPKPSAWLSFDDVLRPVPQEGAFRGLEEDPIGFGPWVYLYIDIYI